jgi:hypothetical protein
MGNEHVTGRNRTRGTCRSLHHRPQVQFLLIVLLSARTSQISPDSASESKSCAARDAGRGSGRENLTAVVAGIRATVSPASRTTLVHRQTDRPSMLQRSYLATRGQRTLRRMVEAKEDSNPRAQLLDDCGEQDPIDRSWQAALPGVLGSPPDEHAYTSTSEQVQ